MIAYVFDTSASHIRKICIIFLFTACQTNTISNDYDSTSHCFSFFISPFYLDPLKK